MSLLIKIINKFGFKENNDIGVVSTDNVDVIPDGSIIDPLSLDNIVDPLGNAFIVDPSPV